MIDRSRLHSEERERFVEDLLGYMTLEEKAGQLVLVSNPSDVEDTTDDSTFFGQLRKGRVSAVGGSLSRAFIDSLQEIAIEETRLGIPLLVASELGTGVETIMPSPLQAASSWDMAAIEKAETIVAAEACERGINWALSPEIRLTRDASSRHVTATSGEDGWLASRIAVARVRGLQGEDLSNADSLLACLELGQEPLHGNVSTASGKRSEALKTLPILHAAMREAQVGSVTHGIDRAVSGRGPPSSSQALEYLGSQHGYGGIVLSEWSDMAALAGNEEIFASPEGMSVDALVQAVEDGRVPELRLDEAVKRVLGAKFDLGLFRSPFSPEAQQHRPRPPIPGHSREVALELARKSIVLLRNDPALLPLSVSSGEILVVGSAARDRELPLDGRSGSAASVIDGLEELGVPFKYAPGLALRQGKRGSDKLIDADRMAIGMASEAAKRAGTVILVLGAGAPDRKYGTMGDAHRQLLGSLMAANERVILVTLGSRPLNPVISGTRLPCLLHAGPLGTMSGHAIAEVLTGEVAPSGKLACAFPARDERFSFPFGHGLSYGEFTQSNFALELGVDRILASLDLRNAGELEGSETVQLYIRRVDGPGRMHAPELRGFAKISLEPGEQRKVSFALGSAQLGRFVGDGRYHLDDGRYEILIGANADDARGGEIYLPAAVAEAMTTGQPGPGATPLYPEGRRRA